jgi:hypothetical protein
MTQGIIQTANSTDPIAMSFTRDDWEVILASLYSGGGVAMSIEEQKIIKIIENALDIEC